MDKRAIQRNIITLGILAFIIGIAINSKGLIKAGSYAPPLRFSIVQVSLPDNSVQAARAAVTTNNNLLSDVASQVEDNFAMPLSQTSKTCSSKAIDEVQATETINGYRLTVIKPTDDNKYDDMSLCVSKHGQIVYEVHDHLFTPLLSDYDKDENGDYRFLSNTQDFINYAQRDITHSGKPELVFQSYSGGAHCCITNHIVELGRNVNVLSDLFSGNADVQLRDLDNDGIPEMQTYDDNFAYWNTGYATSPFLPIVLSYNSRMRKYAVNTKLMQRLAPTTEEMQAQAQGWRWFTEDWEGYAVSRPENTQYGVPWGYAADLIYSGNAKAAQDYINLVWQDNETFSSRDDFWRQFNDELKKSQFYGDIFTSGIAGAI